ncbi:DNA repair licencing factor MCM2 [Carpediemonas membranifera]|uniref:DNA replication licensing factor MCM2 n=1 Tax=Carpediemonas membranifera TaxID=201153 RepID=A0A8J6E2A6_9EUKA|nr:DNA repair licencing factor MCM2 [Carpediemonas membranifera]|eukprot:KAG9394091.1 DNA repair licencing factor MCM2 [Carpediemonas membranifera]
MARERARIMGDYGQDEDERIAGDNLDEFFAADYAENPELDNYESEGLDDEVQERITAAQVAEATRVIHERARRDIEHNRRTPAALLHMAWLDNDEDDMEQPEGVNRLRLVSRANRALQEHDLPEPSQAEETTIATDPLDGGQISPDHIIRLAQSLADIKGMPIAFSENPETQQSVYNLFLIFLTFYHEEKRESAFYRDAAQSLFNQADPSSKSPSLEVDLSHMTAMHELLPGIAVVDACESMRKLILTAAPALIPVLDQAATDFIKRNFPLYASLEEPRPFKVRFTQPENVNRMGDLCQDTVNTLVALDGVISRRSELVPCLVEATFRCQACGGDAAPVKVTDRNRVTPPRDCPHCSARNKFRLEQVESRYENFRRITLTEPPTSVEPGRMPLSVDVVLTDDLVDLGRPGELITVIGVFTDSIDPAIARMTGFPVTRTVIEANNVISPETEPHIAGLDAELERLKNEPNIEQRVCNSIAHTIHGHEDAKTAIACALFSGGNVEGSSATKRGDSHVLLIGDPGLAKSQMLMFTKKVAPRPIYTTGKGASAVGLTAAVRRDPISGEMTLQAGALVLSDRGVCIIDEFDKMSEQDRSALHEGMEQQRISINKAGINAELNARSTVVAAGNPRFGKYDVNLPLAANVELSDPILSRFDLIIVMRDTIDPDEDARLVRFVANRIAKAGVVGAALPVEEEEDAEAEDNDFIPADLLREYIARARTIDPKIASNEDLHRFEAKYSEIRSKLGGTQNSRNLNARHMEAVIRIAKAHARMRLSAVVNREDSDFAWRVFLNSYISQQRLSDQRGLRDRLKEYIVDERNVEMEVWREIRACTQQLYAVQLRQGKTDFTVRISLETLRRHNPPLVTNREQAVTKVLKTGNLHGTGYVREYVDKSAVLVRRFVV